MRFEDMNWMQVENYLTLDNRVILVLGSCEQHGYLSLLSDIRIPLALADAVSQKSGVPVAPALHFGVSPSFVTYPGTISLRLTTFMQVVEEVVRCLHKQGFRRFLVLNGHGGNDGIKARLTELANELPDLKVIWHAWFNRPAVSEFVQAHGLFGDHASWMEAFPFTRVAELPPGEKPPVVKPPWIMNAAQTRQTVGDGVYGGAYQVDAKLMQELFQVCVDDILPLLAFAG